MNSLRILLKCYVHLFLRNNFITNHIGTTLCSTIDVFGAKIIYLISFILSNIKYATCFVVIPHEISVSSQNRLHLSVFFSGETITYCFTPPFRKKFKQDVRKISCYSKPYIWSSFIQKTFSHA